MTPEKLALAIQSLISIGGLLAIAWLLWRDSK